MSYKMRTQKMNLKMIYEIFYPGRGKDQSSVWKGEIKYRSKKEFFEEIFPMELRWLNIKLWNDKARRSRFLKNIETEKNYVSALKNYILENPMVISRMENRCCQMLKNDISPHQMNEIFFQLTEQEKISFSLALKKYLMCEEQDALKGQWGNVLTFLILYVIFSEEINQLYMPYLCRKEKTLAYSKESQEKYDSYLFQYEYPPDMSIYKPGEQITHTWVVKNVGKVPWEQRSFGCANPPDWLEKENKDLEIAGTIYPGDMVSLTACFCAPSATGHYVLHWKMKNNRGDLVFGDRIGLGLHFTVVEENRSTWNISENNYRILDETHRTPATIPAGKVCEYSWIIENTGSVTWENYYCECINGDVWGYHKKELRIPMKKRIEPGEYVSIHIEFVTPPIEGSYKLVWRIMEKGRSVFPESRQLEVLLNLV